MSGTPTHHAWPPLCRFCSVPIHSDPIMLLTRMPQGHDKPTGYAHLTCLPSPVRLSGDSTGEHG